MLYETYQAQTIEGGHMPGRWYYRLIGADARFPYSPSYRTEREADAAALRRLTGNRVATYTFPRSLFQGGAV